MCSTGLRSHIPTNLSRKSPRPLFTSTRRRYITELFSEFTAEQRLSPHRLIIKVMRNLNLSGLLITDPFPNGLFGLFIKYDLLTQAERADVIAEVFDQS